MLRLKLGMVLLSVAMIVSAAAVLRAQAASDAPIPSQILTARKVFISNAGGKLSHEFNSNEKSGTYDEFYAVVKNWGRFQLVSSPSEADLIFQVGLDPITPGSLDPNQIRLEIRDPKTNTLIWTVDEGVHWNRPMDEKDRSKAMSKLIDDLKALTAAPAK